MRAGRALAWAALRAGALRARRLRRGRARRQACARPASRGTPDEFMVLPTRPLEMPQNLAALPPPTPGAVNRVDYRPHTEAVAGLTGRPGPAGSGGARAGRRGRPARPGDPHRSSPRRTWSGARPTTGGCSSAGSARDREALIYRPMVLDAPDAFEQQRARGRQVPAAPPAALLRPSRLMRRITPDERYGGPFRLRRQARRRRSGCARTTPAADDPAMRGASCRAASCGASLVARRSRPAAAGRGAGGRSPASRCRTG